jgi:hypothetical protein
MAKVQLKAQVPLDEFLRQLTDGAYQVIKNQCTENFSEDQLKERLRDVIQRILSIDMVVGEECGLSLFCQETTLSPPWSDAAQEAMRSDQEANGKPGRPS